MNSWENGAPGWLVKKIIDENFSKLNERLNQLSIVYTEEFTASDWKDGVINISLQKCKKNNPLVEL